MMQYIHNTFDFKIEEDTVITLGKFDGLHRGHELLMENLLNWREKYRYKAVVFTFDIPPRQQVNGVGTRVLTTNEEKRAARLGFARFFRYRNSFFRNAFLPSTTASW